MTTMYIFLDIDGVCHPVAENDFRCVGLLERWLLANPDVWIVISSSWRIDWTLQQLKSFFPPQIRPRIVGVTPRIMGASRIQEVYKYVERAGIQHWVAIDDSPENFTRHHRDIRWLIVTESHHGLTPTTILQLDAFYRRFSHRRQCEVV